MNKDYHRSLQRQIRKHLPDGKFHPEMVSFLDAVNQSYEDRDASIYLHDRAVNISSRELEDKNKQLMAKNELMDSFIYRVSHDLKNPLQNIFSLIEMLKMNMGEAANPMTENVISHIDKAAQKMMLRLEDLLKLSKVENLVQTSPVTVDLKEEFQSILEEQALSIQKHKATIQYDFSAVPSLMFVQENLRSIMANFLSNAIKYRSPDRTPHLHIITKKSGNELCISFTDNGMGIDLDKHGQKLFGMFQRFHNHVEGSGVGLFIIKKIIETAGGRITVTSQLGHGSQFQVYLPVALMA